MAAPLSTICHRDQAYDIGKVPVAVGMVGWGENGEGGGLWAGGKVWGEGGAEVTAWGRGLGFRVRRGARARRFIDFRVVGESSRTSKPQA